MHGTNISFKKVAENTHTKQRNTKHMIKCFKNFRHTHTPVAFCCRKIFFFYLLLLQLLFHFQRNVRRKIGGVTIYRCASFYSSISIEHCNLMQYNFLFASLFLTCVGRRRLDRRRRRRRRLFRKNKKYCHTFCFEWCDRSLMIFLVLGTSQLYTLATGCDCVFFLLNTQ